jgi:hypothetical protein
MACSVAVVPRGSCSCADAESIPRSLMENYKINGSLARRTISVSCRAQSTQQCGGWRATHALTAACASW